MPMSALTGSRLRGRRVALGMRQADLAALVGLSASYLNLIEHNRRRIADYFKIDPSEAEYLLIEGQVSNTAYLTEMPIYIRRRSGYIQELTEATDLPSISAMAGPLTKYYVCWPKEVGV